MKEILELLNNVELDHIFVSSDWHILRELTPGNKSNDNVRNLDEFATFYNQRITSDDDILIFLGDLAHKDLDTIHDNKVKEFYKLLKGKKILIKGNHDIKDDEFYHECGFDYILDSLTWNDIYFCHYPSDDEELLKHYLSIHGHYHGHLCFSKQWIGKPRKNHINVFYKLFGNEIPTLKYLLDNKKDLDESNHTNRSGVYYETINGEYKESLAGIAPVTSKNPTIVKPVNYNNYNSFLQADDEEHRKSEENKD